MPHILIPPGRLAEFCRKHYIVKLSFFGSVLRDDFGPQSDVDVLVEFDPAHVPGLLRFVGMQMELADLLGREVDLNTPNSLSHLLQKRILSEAEAQYVEAR